MSTPEDLKGLYTDELKDLWSANDQMQRVLKEIAPKTSDPSLRCLIPRFDGVILSAEWKEAIWARYVTGAPRPRTPSEQRYSDRRLRSRR
jgi:hypothetical protein